MSVLQFCCSLIIIIILFCLISLYFIPSVSSKESETIEKMKMTNTNHPPPIYGNDNDIQNPNLDSSLYPTECDLFDLQKKYWFIIQSEQNVS